MTALFREDHAANYIIDHPVGSSLWIMTIAMSSFTENIRTLTWSPEETYSYGLFVEERIAPVREQSSEEQQEAAYQPGGTARRS